MTDRVIYTLCGHVNSNDILTLADGQAVFASPASVAAKLTVITPQQFGAVANNATDDHAADAAMQAYRQTLRQVGTGYGYSEAMPAGTIPFGISYQGTTPTDLYGGGILGGETGSIYSGGGSTLRWGASTTGIRLQYNNTTGETTYDASTALNTVSSSGTLLRGFTMEGGAGTGDHPGIRAKAPFAAEDMFINGFAGAGITANCNLTDTTLGTHGNASSSQIWRCTIQGCGADGVRFQGADASIFLIAGSTAVANAGYGFADFSEFGGVLLACHASDNALGAYHTDAAQSSAHPLLLGCYEEGSQPQSTFSQGTLIVGGSWALKPSGGGYVYASGDKVRVNALGVDGNIDCEGAQHTVGPITSGSPADTTLTFQSTNSVQIVFNRYNTSGVLQATDGSIIGAVNGLQYKATSFHQFYVAGSRVFYCDNGGLKLDTGMTVQINAVQVVGARDTGWAADTGTAKKTANATYAAGTTLTYSATYVQAEQTAMATRMAAVETALQNATQTIMAMKAALTAHGLIGT